jgi:hypothetical protein
MHLSDAYAEFVTRLHWNIRQHQQVEHLSESNSY